MCVKHCHADQCLSLVGTFTNVLVFQTELWKGSRAVASTVSYPCVAYLLCSQPLLADRTKKACRGHTTQQGLCTVHSVKTQLPNAAGLAKSQRCTSVRPCNKLELLGLGCQVHGRGRA